MAALVISSAIHLALVHFWIFVAAIARSWGVKGRKQGLDEGVPRAIQVWKAAAEEHGASGSSLVGESSRGRWTWHALRALWTEGEQLS